jgi:hypothetical protein
MEGSWKGVCLPQGRARLRAFLMQISHPRHGRARGTPFTAEPDCSHSNQSWFGKKAPLLSQGRQLADTAERASEQGL